MTDAEIAALKAAALKATPGGWRAAGLDVFTDGHRRVNLTTVAKLQIAQVFDHHCDGFGGKDDAAYIALANPDAILALIARLEATERSRDWYRCACAEADDRAQAAEARAERLAAVLEAEREERRAERAVREAGDALVRAEARDDEWAYVHAMKQHDAALQAYDLMYNRAEAARAALAAERGEAEGGES